MRRVAYRLPVSRSRRAKRALRAPDRAYATSGLVEPDVSRSWWPGRCSSCRRRNAELSSWIFSDSGAHPCPHHDGGTDPDINWDADTPTQRDA